MRHFLLPQGDLQVHRFLYSAFGLDPEPLSSPIPPPTYLRRFQFLVAPERLEQMAFLSNGMNKR